MEPTKEYWDIVTSNNECRSRVWYGGYISCHHWTQREHHPPLACGKDICPIKPPVIVEENKS